MDVPVTTITPPKSPPSPFLRVAPHGRRCAAFLIDFVVYVFENVWLGLVEESIGWRLPLKGGIFALVLFALYWVPAWTITGTTLGKWLMGLQLITRTGYRPNLLRSCVRCFVLLLLTMLGFTWWSVLTRADRRAMHDLLAGTYLVQVREENLWGHLQIAFIEHPYGSTLIAALFVGAAYLVLVRNGYAAPPF